MDLSNPVERNRRQVEAARDLRQRMTRAEELLWSHLRDRQVEGLKFRRQHPVGPFVLDFCCPSRRLVIELDGGIHHEIAAQDAERTRLLVANGYHVIRFRNEDVLGNIEHVLARITQDAIAAVRPLSHARERGGALAPG